MSLLLLEKPSVRARASVSGAIRTGSLASEILRGCVAEKHRSFNPMRVGQRAGFHVWTRARRGVPVLKVLRS